METELRDYLGDIFDMAPGTLEAIVCRPFKRSLDLLGDGGYELANWPWLESAFLRYFTFVILGLRHTCCCLVDKVSGPLPEEECQEIAAEDTIRLELLEKLVKEFQTERGHYADLESFIREYWFPRMRRVDQDLASSMLTEEQRREAERVGVVWEDYRPQLPTCSNGFRDKIKQRGEVISRLEKLMRDLDEIATDPERPFVG